MTEEKLDQILKNQAVIIGMLTDLLEATPDVSERPDIREVMRPLISSPIIENNPALKGMLSQMMNNMGGTK